MLEVLHVRLQSITEEQVRISITTFSMFIIHTSFTLNIYFVFHKYLMINYLSVICN